MTRKGQITVPAEIRKALGIEIGDKVGITLDTQNGSLRATLRRVGSIADMTFGSVTPRKRPEDFHELRQMFMESAAERDERTKRP
jgi:AbrB family looped-hinge helix DNA binding protein